MKLNNLLKNITDCNIDLEISGLTLDSREIKAGDAFIALRGHQQHGLVYAEQAIRNGAAALIIDTIDLDAASHSNLAVPYVAVTDLHKHLGGIASRFYGHPSEKIKVLGITGTNGKTTCSQLIAQALGNCGVIGTLGWGEYAQLLPTLNTTPDAVTIQRILEHFLKEQKHAVAMEVSSHALQQGRVDNVNFAGAIFTNLSRDHLDYHGNMDEYLQAKLALFSKPGLQFAVINLDDDRCQHFMSSLHKSVKCWTYTTRGKKSVGSENLSAENIRFSPDGIYWDVFWGDRQSSAFTPLVGRFNLENVMAVLAVLLAMGTEFHQAILRLAQLQAVAGRMEKFGGGNKPTVYVDYAHSPDALEKVLKVAKSTGKLSVVFGCGGDRDKGKRPEMGKLAENLADRVFVTDDNPRTESSSEIIRDILAGCQSRKAVVISDRRLAISSAIQQANANDCVVVAGKGHENFQEINGVKLPFSDQEIVQQSLAIWSETNATVPH